MMALVIPNFCLPHAAAALVAGLLVPYDGVEPPGRQATADLQSTLAPLRV